MNGLVEHRGTAAEDVLKHRWKTGLKSWLVAFVAFAGLGCSGPLPTGPAVDASSDATIACTAEVSIGPSTGSLVTDPQWYTVASKSIQPLLGGVVSGSRYKITLPPLALTKTTTISVREYSPNVLDFELLPHGTPFLVPVTVDVDYSGTSLDPASPNYQGGLPVLLWLNPGTGLWELVPGVNNPLTKKYTVLLTHFSRYAVGKQQGTAEW